VRRQTLHRRILTWFLGCLSLLPALFDLSIVSRLSLGYFFVVVPSPYPYYGLMKADPLSYLTVMLNHSSFLFFLSSFSNYPLLLTPLLTRTCSLVPQPSCNLEHHAIEKEANYVPTTRRFM
jgi:hypothetical protein